MQLYFIRHAQSTNNALWAATGAEAGRHEDPPLTALGQEQARRAADWLAHCPNPARLADDSDLQNRTGFRLTHLYTSLMTRAVATAVPIAERTGVPLVAWPELHETGGLYLDDPRTGRPAGQPGPNRQYFEAQFPGVQLPDELGAAGWWNRPHEEEPERWDRAQHVWATLQERHGRSDDRVGVVSHGAFYNYLLITLCGSASRQGFWFALNNTAVTRIDWLEGHARIAYHNRADHLPAELIT